MELKSVYQLNKQAKILEEKVSGLKDARSNLVPTLNGLPKSHSAGSKVEDLTIKILALEEELTTLREQIVTSSVELAAAITERVSSAASRILIARYVGCSSWRKIIAEAHYSPQHVFRLHAQGVKQFKETIKNVHGKNF